MKNTITVTRKGQTTLPAVVRRKLGLGQAGGILKITFDEQRYELTISKPMSIEELSERTSRHIKPGTKPLLNIDSYYQKHRKPRI